LRCEKIGERQSHVDGGDDDSSEGPAAASSVSIAASATELPARRLQQSPEHSKLRDPAWRIRLPRDFPPRGRLMRRIPSAPRSDWRKRVEAAGLTWHTVGSFPYWDESAFYEFTAPEADLLADATNELERMTREAVQHAIDNRLYTKMAIPELAVPLIECSWEAEAPSLYGRFDLIYDGCHPPKLLEYNADTPTSLLEAAVVQWHWLEETRAGSDQFNSIHERLIAQWRDLAAQIPDRHVDFCSMDDAEDWGTATYLEDTAQQAGL
jgi:glutathionylspermidine synthase